ncbi:lysylphosphatidylglycerol synthase domain-containing protein [Hyalangium sp.]|uniref:lysylphosphatidylglycerol synthase domain-containing protein n=1 Tax=Hyalangium sp. TaxID=2028555 RepID=UPI0038998ADB
MAGHLTRKQILLYGAALGVAGVGLTWAFHDVDFRQVWAEVARLGPAVTWVLVPYGVSVLFDGMGLRRILAALGRGAQTLRLVSIRFASEALTFSVPGGAVLSDGARLMFLQSRCDVPVTEGVSSLAARKCLALKGHGVFLAISTALGWGFLSARSKDLLGIPGLPVFLGGTAVVLLLVAAGTGKALSGGGTAARLGMLLERLPMRALRAWLERRRAAFSQTDTHLGRALERRAGGRAAPYYLLMWLAEGVEGYLMLRLLGLPVSFFDAMAIEAVISVARSAAFFVPAGLGIQDASYVALLSAGGKGASLEMAATFALLKRARELFWMGLGFALLLHGRARQPRVIAARSATG